MANRWFLRLVLAVFVIGLVIGWLVLSGRVAYFSLDKRLPIAIDGVPVQGEVLGNGTSAIVTIREAGKKHSYLLFYEGDVDITGDMGFVADCQQWLAPRVPFLLQTRSYPPCKRIGPQRLSLIRRGHSMQFATDAHSTVSIPMPE